MPRIPIFGLGQTPEAVPPRLISYTPAMSLHGLQCGVDNLRHDVYLSARFVEQTRLHVARLIARHGAVEGLLAAEAPEAGRGSQIIGAKPAPQRAKAESAELKPILTELQVSALNRAKADANPALDVLARVAIIKFLRTELNAQFEQMLERCRIMLKSYEGVRQQKALEYRDRVSEFQIRKKIILRKTGQDLLRTLREIEKETLARMRRSLFGSVANEDYTLFLNSLLFTQDASDTYLNAEHYVILGNFERDPDRFSNIRRVASQFLQAMNGPDADEKMLDSWLNAPENAQELAGGGTPDESPEGRAQKVRLQAWVDLLEAEDLVDYVVASYEVAPLLAEYSPRIHPQQLKNALIFRDERNRVEKLIKEHGKLSCDPFYTALERVAGCRSTERAKIAGRFLRDFMRYHRDVRRLEVLNAAMDSINLIGNERLRQLSAMNGSLYEFLLAEEQKPGEDKVRSHVILKADVRDSSRLTRSLLERELNPASYFSLNFYGPVNKLISKYGATKVFLEGDAIILAILEREGEPGLAVARACVLGREIIEIVHGYNQLLERAGLPVLELGLGISYQNSAPMYLMDGEQRIMISDALNESDRLSSCSKRVRKPVKQLNTPFNVYEFQSGSDGDLADNPDDFLLRYNLNGIRISEAAFARLKEEISLEECSLDVPSQWDDEEFHLYSGLVPLGKDIFRKIIVRQSYMPQIDPRDCSPKRWTQQKYYEVCSNPAIYNQLEEAAAAGG
jgi:hypothetical protein